MTDHNEELDGGWYRESNVDCVVCPSCAFTFDAVHSDPDGGYSCPLCELDEAAALADSDIPRAGV